jgi:hypothetical protein
MSENLMKEFLKDSGTTQATDEELQSISALAANQRRWEIAIADLNDELKTATENLKQIQEFLLPEAMASVGMSEFKLTDGSKITIKEDIYASIRAEKIPNAMEWLTEKGLGDIIKDEIKVNFGRGESERANELIELCKEHGFEAQEKMTVHPMTLKATIKEQMAKGVQFPDEFFSVAPVRKSVIKMR